MATPSSSRLPGFEHVNSYYDKYHEIDTAKLLPGEYYVTTQREAIVTVLGSCVSACIRDKVFGIGGMNHFMLPLNEEHPDSWSPGVVDHVTRYGNYAMEHLINEILSHGGVRENLEIKVFGGGRILQGLPNIGGQNAKFVLDYLREESLPVSRQDLNGCCPRKVYYFPKTGRALVKKLRSMHNDTLRRRESEYLHRIEDAPVGGEVVLF